MANITRKSEKTVATVTASSRKISVNVTDKLTVAESKELRALLKEQEKVASAQSASYAWIFDEPIRYNFGARI